MPDAMTMTLLSYPTQNKVDFQLTQKNCAVIQHGCCLGGGEIMTSYINLKGMPSIETCAWNFVNNLAPIAGCWARTRGNWNANKYYKTNLPSQQRNPLCLHVAWTSVWIPPAKKIGISFFAYSNLPTTEQKNPLKIRPTDLLSVCFLFSPYKLRDILKRMFLCSFHNLCIHMQN